MLIKNLEIAGHGFVNVPCEKDILVELGMTESDADVIIAQTQREFELKQIRAKRNQLLIDADWTQLADVQLTDDKKAEFAEYRQQLRDVPQQLEMMRSFDIGSIVWPVKPELK